jgi:hypothetical protein
MDTPQEHNRSARVDRHEEPRDERQADVEGSGTQGLVDIGFTVLDRDVLDVGESCAVEQFFGHILWSDTNAIDLI